MKLFLFFFLSAGITLLHSNEAMSKHCTTNEFPVSKKAAITAAKKFIPLVTAGSRSETKGYDLRKPEICTFIGKDCDNKDIKLVFVRFHNTSRAAAPLHIIMKVDNNSDFSLIDGGFTLTQSDTMIKWRRKADCEH